MSGESSKVDKHDQMVQADKKNNVDVFNGMKKADLNEEEKKELPKSIADKERDQIEKDAKKAKGMIKEDPKENIIAVAKEIRAKYGQIPGFTPLLKDFLFTHQHEIKAGEVGPEDAIAEFDNYIDANYDRLDEKDNEGYNTDPNLTMHIDDDEWEEEMGRKVNEYRGSGDEIKAIIRDRAADSGFSEQEEAQEVMEFIGQEYEIDFEFGAGPSRMAEKKGKDHDGDGDIDGDDYMAAKDKAIKKAMGKDKVVKENLKAIISKVLEEQVINEAATNELARIADDYADFDGMKQTIVALQNIVTEIESFYDKTRDKIQKIYDSIGEVRNEEGLKVGAFLAPSIEAAFNKDLRPAIKAGFTKGLETPKVKMISKGEAGRGSIQQEAPKDTLFTPVNEKKK